MTMNNFILSMIALAIWCLVVIAWVTANFFIKETL